MADAADDAADKDKDEKRAWIEPSSDRQPVEAGYDVWLAGEIEAGCAELDAGEGIPALEVWRQLGLE